MSTYYVAIDLGAESGRVSIACLNRGRLTMSEIHRFPNIPVREKESVYWDIPQIYEGVIQGLRKVGLREDPISSISCDSWGVDYLLFDDENTLIAPTYHYRDARCQEGVKEVLGKLTWETIYSETGIQKMPINTIFQLGAEKSRRIGRAARFLTIADGFNFLLSGAARIEVSMASTTQLYNPIRNAWSERILSALRLSPKIFPPIVGSGTKLGPLRPEIAQQVSIDDALVVASLSHDTAAAVAGIPASGENWAYLSSGTWSLMGVELPEPIITDHSRELNFTNEIGFGGSVRFLKNIVGLWLLQECRRFWADREQDLDYEVMTHLASSAPPFESLINPMDPRFLAAGDMPLKIQAYCRETGQVVPKKPGPIIRCVLESLALLYRKTLLELESVTGRKIDKLYVVGGGTKNTLLNHFTANATQIPVIVGPPESTSIGNVLGQAIALGHVSSLEEGRKIVSESFKPQQLMPHAVAWNEAYNRLEELTQPAAG